MTGIRITHDVPAEDDAGHVPGPQESWQESFCVLWYDPRDRVGGHFHTGLQKNRGVADYWSHLVVDGRIVAHELAVAAPLKDGDYPSLKLGPLEISTLEPLRSYRIQAAWGDVTCDARYEAFPGPVRGFDMDHPGTPIGKGHFESYGSVEGTIEVAGRRVEFRGLGLHDHSWGPRAYDSLLAVRNVIVNFGPDLHFQTFSTATAQGLNSWGYIVADGEIQSIVAITGQTNIDEDGYSPLGFDLTLWTESGRGFHVTGVSDCTTYAVTTAGTVRGMGYLRCEMGGRVGGGQIVVVDMHDAAPWQLEALRG
jgi:hypothetical protein